MELKQISKDGITYEHISPELFVRNGGETLIVNEDTGEKKVFFSWKYEDDKIPSGWRTDESPLPQDSVFVEQMRSQGRTEMYHKVSGQRHVHYEADGPPPDNFEIDAHYQSPKDGRRNLLKEMRIFFDDQKEYIPLETQVKTQGSRMRGEDKLPHFDMDHLVDYETGELEDFHCLTARRDGHLIGVLTFKVGQVQPDGSRLGMIDRGLVKKTERKTEIRQNREGIPPSDYLIRLAIGEILTEFGCTEVVTDAVSLQGEHFSERNGFQPKTGFLMYNHLLDERVVKKIQELAKTKEGESGSVWEKLPEIIEAISPMIQEISAEIRNERERESTVASEQRAVKPK